MQIMRVLRDEALEERLQDMALRHAGDGLRIEILRLGAVAPVQDLIAIPAGDAAAAGDATGRRGGQPGQQDHAQGRHRAEPPCA
jgi:hypothetical protein